MNNRHRGTAAAGSVMAVLMLAAGCSGGDSDRAVDSVQPAGAGQAIGKGYDSGAGSGSGAGYGAPGTGANPAAGAGSGYGDEPAAAAKAAPAGQLALRDIPEVGKVVTDSAGATLYRFDKDTPKPPKSNCEGGCAATWPVVSADDAKASAGIDPSMLGSVERADGTKQLTLGGWPVYRYSKEGKAGEAKGEGVGGTWHALAADGKKAIDKKDAEPPKKDVEPPKTGDNGGMGDMNSNEKIELAVAANEKLGKILVDAQGRTLYRFNKDSAWPMKIGCLDACVNTWKPAPPVDKAKAAGIPAGLIGKVKRPDGSEQLTIDCWPVYLFTGDKEPGDTNGQGKQGLWFAVNDAGKKVTTTTG
ncbi:SCO0930 family lipoprotein [Streptomyces sp. NPDC060334]|uniref:SCO0930 family lipoprotein n=1 Tax=Streptomyces sp. NPDC060334 TaxID=3347099 RepID=UPI00364EFB85